MLEVTNLECARGDRRLFAGVGFRLDAGELLHVSGHNGAGKTTLLRTLVGLTQPVDGEIRWQGAPVAKLGEDYRGQLAYLGHGNGIKEELTPLENLAVSARVAGLAADEERDFQALGEVGLASRADLPCRVLSQGQKRRVALARLIRDRRPLWVLDEPFVALDVAAVAWLAERIGAHVAGGGLAVLTTHQPVTVPGATVRGLWLGECGDA